MNSEEIICIHFTLNFPAETIFRFVIRPENMVLYTGFLLIPGIKNVHSSDSDRKMGTLDKISNTDGSSHESTTDVLEKNQRYSLTIRNIQMTGFKKKLANPILGFREDWIFSENKNRSTTIDRSLVIVYKKGLLNTLFVNFIVRPQMHFSLLKHHQNLLKNLS
ncbi:MAG: hypothetical protein H7336_05440 [Bacteriovorax sp.]|nr:hypothetical protein [Bacteriovorax sp.]